MDIAVDLDGVVWDLTSIFLDIYNEDYNENLIFEECTKWFQFPQKRFEAVYPKTLKRIDDYPFLDENINHYLFLLMGKHNVKILTQNQNTIEKLKKKLETQDIKEGFEYLELIRLSIPDNKLNYKFDVYIDDNPNMIEHMSNYPDRILLLYEEPWNKKWDINDYVNVLRVKNWNDVMKKIEELENERNN